MTGGTLDGSPPIFDRRSLVLCLALSVMVFSFHLYLARVFDGLQLFDQLNVLFNSDPPSRVNALAQGWGMRLLKHPHFSNFFSPLIRALVEIGGWLGMVDGDGRAARDSLALVVTPAVSAMGTGALFFTFRLLGLRLLCATAASLLGMLSFSQIIFASIPDTFGISGGLLALLFLYAVVVLRKPGADRWWIWGLLAFIAAGVTITQAASVGVVLWSVRLMQGHPVWLAFRKSVAITAGALVLVVLTSYGIKLAIESPDDQASWGYFDGTANFAREDNVSMARAVGNFPRAVWLTFIARDPEIFKNRSAIAGDKPIRIQFGFEGKGWAPGDGLRGLGGIMLLLLGGLTCWRLGGPWRMIALASAGILLSNWLLHSFWGEEIFLYSQHWHVPALLLLAGLLAVEGRRRSTAQGVFAAVVIAAAISNFEVLSDMLAGIRTYL